MANIGALSSLGVGSKGVLSYDLIEKLKGAEEKAQIKPLEDKLKENLTKKKDLTEISIMLRNTKTSISALSSELNYLGRSVNKNGNSATLSAEAGSDLQSLRIDVKQLATKDTYQGVRLENAGSTLARDGFEFQDGKIKIEIGGKDYDVKIKSTDNLKTIAENIKKATGDKVIAKVMNVGGDNPYQLIIQSKETGIDNAIKIKADISTEDPANPSVKENSEKILKALGWSTEEITVDGKQTTQMEQNHITKAQDAEFVYNDVVMKRPSNTIKNLQPGLTLNLIDKGVSTFEVTQDIEKISTNIQKFVEDYNKLISNLEVATDYNEETGNAGTFQGSREIFEIKSKINRVLISANEDGGSLIDSGFDDAKVKLGIKMNEDGMLSFDKSTFEDSFRKDPKLVERYFRGGTTYSDVRYLSNEIHGGGIEASAGKIIINGESIQFSTYNNNNTKNNALTLMNVINKTSVGLKAELNTSKNGIILTGKDGENIEIKDGNIKFTTNSENNALALIEAINKASIGLEAKLNKNKDGVILVQKDSANIEMKDNNINFLISPKDNALALIEAINKSPAGLNAKLNANENGIILTGKDGTNIEIKGDEDFLKNIGLTPINITAKSKDTEGFFARLDSTFDSFISNDGSLTMFDKELSDSRKNLTQEKAKAQKLLNDRYDTLAQKFAAYDQMINKLNNQFMVLQNMINAELNAKK